MGLKLMNLGKYLTPAFMVGVSSFVLFGINGASLIFVLATLLLCLSLYIAKKEKCIESFWVVVFSVIVLINQIPFMAGVGGTDFYIFLATVLSCLLVLFVSSSIYSVSSLYSIKGQAEIKDKRAYIVFKKPKTFIDHLYAYIGINVSSISFCIDKKWIRYTQKNGTAEKCEINQRDGFIFIDIGSSEYFDMSKFEAMAHKPWSWHNNCVIGWKPMLENMWLEPKPWEWLPSIYAKRVIEVLKNENRC